MIHRLREAEAEEAKRFSSVSDDMMNVVEAVVSTPSLASQSPDALAEQLASKSETTPRPPPVFSSKVRLPKRPRGIILVPTRDLVDQVTQVAKTLCSHNARLIVMGIHSRPRHAASVKRKIATSPVDILVCTPRALATHFEDHELLPDRVQEIVVDEADTLMDTSFAYELDQCLDPIMKRKVDDETPETLFTYVSATFPRTMITRLTKIHPTHIRIATPKLHKTLPGLKQTFLRVSGSDSKPTLLLDTLKMGRIGGDAHVIVFCNRVQTAEWVGDMLRGKGFNVGVLTASTDASERQLIVKEFCGERKGKEMRKEDEFRVLVATDAVSRGVDTVAVDHVVLYEFPHTAIDFLHRGRATSFVTKRDVALATAIEAAGRKGEMLA
ncbi:P-loop containing nucleoside triphosphate hydrolase protein [Chytridium lagenaria]|nr:P-loop containing nucleoside triphosphate hydrolase protein [Chytridium lagenaria]